MRSLTPRGVALAPTIAVAACGDDFSPTVENVGGGTTTGEIFVEGGGEDGGDLDEDLAGTWTLTGSTVTFDLGADTFIRDVEFTADEDRLTAEDTCEDVTIRLVLTKTE
jgi:hypothetical protein